MALISAILVFVFQSCMNNPKDFELKNGDMLFSVGKDESELLSAIQNATSLKDEIPFSHVGLISIEKDSVFVIEASTENGVVKTPIYEFLNSSADIYGKPLVVVGRVIDEFKNSAKNAPSIAESHLGKEYDFAYDEDNDKFYCSELIRFSFLDKNGNPIFEPLAMSFKNKKTGEISSYWTEHFKKLNLDIPEGKPGTNPADLAKSPIIEIVYFYF